MEQPGNPWYNGEVLRPRSETTFRRFVMAKPHRGLKKANHGSRPATSKARKAKRKHIRT